MTDGSSLSAPARLEYPQTPDASPPAPDLDWDSANDQWPWPIRIRALGRFEVHVDGQVLQTAGKPLTMLRRLVLHGGRAVRIEELISALWPDRGGKTRGVFDVTLMRLRKLLGRPEALLIRHGELALNPQLCWLDLWHFDRCSPPQGFEVDGITISALKSYRGAFLPMDVGDPSSIAIRERLRAHFHAAVLHVGTHLERSGDWNQALQIYHHATQADPLVEDYYYRQMLCQVALGQSGEVRNTYERCRQRVSQEFNLQPSARLDRLLERANVTRSVNDGSDQSFTDQPLQDFVRDARTPDESTPKAWPISIRTLGQFTLTIQGRPQGMLPDGPRRPLDMLRALIALGGLAVPMPALIDAVWDSEQVSPRGAFDTALLRLRKMLAHDDAVRLQGGTVTLNPEVCWVDAWGFERAATRFLKTRLPADAERALALYQGEFLGSVDKFQCAAAMRERLALKFRQIIATLGNLYERARDWESAASAYQRGVAVDGSVEDFYRRLIHCCWRMGRQIDAIRVYHRYRDALQVLSQRSPSAATIELYSQVLDSSTPHS
jgi:DNA-binding SARP family transcriptional activator